MLRAQILVVKYNNFIKGKVKWLTLMFMILFDECTLSVHGWIIKVRNTPGIENTNLCHVCLLGTKNSFECLTSDHIAGSHTHMSLLGSIRETPHPHPQAMHSREKCMLWSLFKVETVGYFYFTNQLVYVNYISQIMNYWLVENFMFEFFTNNSKQLLSGCLLPFFEP